MVRLYSQVMTGSRHRTSQATTRVMPISAVVAALLLGGGIVVGGVLALRSGAPTSRTCTNGVNLTVAVAPRLSAAMSAIAENFRKDSPHVAGRCVTVSVTSRVSDETVTNLASGWKDPTAGPAPDVWIPESASWLGIARAGDAAARLLPEQGITIATSPLVIAMPQPMAESIGWPAVQANWPSVLAATGVTNYWGVRRGHPEWGPFRIGLADPTSSTASLNAVVNLVAATQRTAPASLTVRQLTTDPSIKGAILRLQRATVRVPPSTDALLVGLRQADARNRTLTYLSAFPMQEADVIAYNRGVTSAGGDTGAPRVPLVASYPADGGAVVEDIPYVVMRGAAGDPTRATAAAEFRAAVQSPAGEKVLTDSGFRTPGGRNPNLTTSLGVLPRLPARLSKPVDGTVLAQARLIWSSG
jgi:Ca-activated chloride channel family protein